jgi:hypothetical protein
MSQTNEKVVDALFADFDQASSPGAAVIVIKDGKALFAKGYGLADLEKKIPCTTNTEFPARFQSPSNSQRWPCLFWPSREIFLLRDRLPKFFPSSLHTAQRSACVICSRTHSGLPHYEDHIPDGTTIPLSDRDVLFIFVDNRAKLISCPAHSFITVIPLTPCWR